MKGAVPPATVARPRGFTRVMSSKRVELIGSPANKQVSAIQHSTIDPLKSTVTFEARIETRAKAFSSPGGTITLPDCEVPVGLDGVKRAAISASCNPPDALLIEYPDGCEFVVVNCSVPAELFPEH